MHHVPLSAEVNTNAFGFAQGNESAVKCTRPSDSGSPLPGPSHAPDAPPFVPEVGLEEEVDTEAPHNVGREEEVYTMPEEVFHNQDVIIEIADRHFLTDKPDTIECGIQVQAETMERGAQALAESMDREAQTKDSGAVKPRFSILDIKEDPEAIKYYTSFESYKHFLHILHCLGPAAYELDYKSRILDTENEFFLFMIKLRVNTEDQDLAFRFGISRPTVHRIFHTWLTFLYFQLRGVVKFLPRDVIDSTMPKDFKKKYPRTRIILDATGRLSLFITLETVLFYL